MGILVPSEDGALGRGALRARVRVCVRVCVRAQAGWPGRDV